MNPLRELFCLDRKFLLYNLIVRNLKVRYRRSYFGFLWTLAVPSAMCLVYYFVFQKLARVEIPNYALILISGIIPWTFISNGIASGTESLVSNFSILNKVPISIFAFPLADVISQFITLLLATPVLVAASIWLGVLPTPEWLFMFVLYGFLFLQVYSVTLMSSLSYVYLRDIRHLMGVWMQIWLYLTPILYTQSLIPENYRPLFYLNPFYPIFNAIHGIVISNELPPTLDILYMIVVSFGLLMVAFFACCWMKPNIVERI